MGVSGGAGENVGNMENSEKTKNSGSEDHIYTLFSVLVHEGHGSSQGHYYAFINPELSQWYKFNDHIVEKAKIWEVFENNFGGKVKRGKITKMFDFEEVEYMSGTNAYMLVYVRKNRVREVIGELADSTISPTLQASIALNKRNRQ